MEQVSFIEALTAYKTGQRENPVMRNIAGRLTEDDIAALAAFFAAQKQ
jgi:cytochrome c